MTLDEARKHIADGVVYHPPGGGPAENGVITSVGKWFAFVRYGTQGHSKATAAEYLTLLAATTGGNT